MQSCQPLNITTSAAHSRYLHAFIHVQYVDREWQSLCCGRSSRSPTSFLWLQYIIQVEAHEARMRFCSFFLINPFGSGIGCPHFYFRISSLAIERSVNPCLEIPQHSYIVPSFGPVCLLMHQCSSRTACKFLSANTFCGRNGQIFEYVLASYVLQYDKGLSSLFSFEKLSLVMMCITIRCFGIAYIYLYSMRDYSVGTCMEIL